MRWFWIDKFTEFRSGERAVAVKCVSLGEPHTHDTIPGYPVHPPSLIVEGIAQTGGILVGEYYDYQERVILAKVSVAKFHFHACPGDQLRYVVSMENIQPDGAMIRGVSYVEQRVQAEIDLYYAHLSERSQAEHLFEPAGFLRMLRAFRVYDVAVDADGNPAKIPDYLLEAERLALKLGDASS